jgi:hypothetical protein
MKPAGLPFGNIIMLEMKAARGFHEAFVDGAEVWLRPEVSASMAEALLILPGSRTVASVHPANLPDGPAFRELLASPWPRLAVVAKRISEDALILRVHAFTLLQPWPDLAAIAIGFDDAMASKVAALAGPGSQAADAAAILLDGLSLPPVASGQPYRLFVATADAEPESAFFLHGVELTAKIECSKSAALTLVDVSGPSAPSGRLQIIELTNLSFVAGTAPVPSAVSRNMLLRFVAGTEKYLLLWQQYNALDRARLDAEARGIGYLRYHKVEHRRDKCLRYTLADADGDRLTALREAASREAVELEAGSELPDHLSEDDDGQLSLSPKKNRPARRTKTSRGSCRPDDIDRDGEWIELRIEGRGMHQAPPPEGYLYLSQGGSRAALKRQTIAWQAIRAGRTPMPQLGLILENQPLVVQPIQAVNHITEAVRAQFSSGNPTARQREAIEIAVNTPDIALIQGPPGTGKTEVITAIIKRLEELADPSNSVAGLFLVTSQQHVAVHNVVRKIQPFGLPAIKRGRSRDEQDGAEEVDATRQWADKVIKRIATQTANETKPIAGLRKLERQLEAYERGHHWLDDTAAMLDEVARDAASLASPPLVGEVRKLATRLRAEKREKSRGLSPTHDRAYRAAYALRYEPVAFADDGRAMAARVLDAIGSQDKLTDEDRKILEDAMKEDAITSGGTKLLVALGALRERLLHLLRPDERPLSVIAAPRADVKEKLTQLVADIRRRIYATRSGLALMLDDYAVEIGQNFRRLEETLLQYSAARAETCQGSSETLYTALRSSQKRRGFESVIIDEAARANPLDLLIPMAQARRRIILVGDHNQLPHTLEPKLEGVVKEKFADEEKRALKMSLFERLFLDLQERQERGEIPRTVTLDTQFRMHELLGRFVSDQFYDGKLGSAAVTANYRHGLENYRLGNGDDCVACWIDVPVIQKVDRTIGKEKRGKTRSLSREGEADAIRYAVRDILKRQPEQKIGVISFYADQVALIRDKLKTIGGDLADVVKKNVRVGTIDAFQGEQFPIIFLSMTRSSELALDPDLDPEKRAGRRYGHLMLKNRMCVAFSRQQFLMVVVGDRRMLFYPERWAIGPLIAFDRLCRDSGLHFHWTGRELRTVDHPAEAEPA